MDSKSVKRRVTRSMARKMVENHKRDNPMEVFEVAKSKEKRKKLSGIANEITPDNEDVPVLNVSNVKRPKVKENQTCVSNASAIGIQPYIPYNSTPRSSITENRNIKKGEKKEEFFDSFRRGMQKWRKAKKKLNFDLPEPDD